MSTLRSEITNKMRSEGVYFTGWCSKHDFNYNGSVILIRKGLKCKGKKTEQLIKTLVKDKFLTKDMMKRYEITNR